MLLNQASFRARLNQLSNWSKKDRSNFAVLLLTLDRFPGIKASMGQLVGKQLRKAVAEDTGLIGLPTLVDTAFGLSTNEAVATAIS